MTLPIFGQSARQYQISTEIYSGPLDLLLQLIERAELDITRLSLAKVTDQYLEHLHSIQEQDPIEVSAFLVIAARLVLIKSLALLPKSEISGIELEQDPGEVLARQLILYKKFKEIALYLHNREEAGIRSYLRMASLPRGKQILERGEIKTTDLAQLLLQMLSTQNHIHPLETAVTITTLTLKKKINEIITILRKSSKSNFKSLLTKDNSRLEIIVTFLALLELIRHYSIEVHQEFLFNEIELERVGEMNEDFEPEF